MPQAMYPTRPLRREQRDSSLSRNSPPSLRIAIASLAPTTAVSGLLSRPCQDHGIPHFGHFQPSLGRNPTGKVSGSAMAAHHCRRSRLGGRYRRRLRNCHTQPKCRAARSLSITSSGENAGWIWLRRNRNLGHPGRTGPRKQVASDWYRPVCQTNDSVGPLNAPQGYAKCIIAMPSTSSRQRFDQVTSC